MGSVFIRDGYPTVQPLPITVYEAYPSIIVIDPEGKVAFNSDREPADRDAFMKEMQPLAESLQMSWPPPEDESDEAVSYMNKLLGAMVSREIDQAIASGKK